MSQGTGDPDAVSAEPESDRHGLPHSHPTARRTCRGECH
jgi:hypothetical protein